MGSVQFSVSLRLVLAAILLSAAGWAYVTAEPEPAQCMYQTGQSHCTTP